MGSRVGLGTGPAAWSTIWCLDSCFLASSGQWDPRKVPCGRGMSDFLIGWIPPLTIVCDSGRELFKTHATSDMMVTPIILEMMAHTYYARDSSN